MPHDGCTLVFPNRALKQVGGCMRGAAGGIIHTDARVFYMENELLPSMQAIEYWAATNDIKEMMD
jgi:hypothetical protein